MNSRAYSTARWTFSVIAVLAALALGLLLSAQDSVHGSSHDLPEKPSISEWDRLNEGLRVYWQAPNSDGGSRIIRYDVQYKETRQSEWLDRPYVGVASKTTISGLVPNTEYQVRVRAVNANGAGPWSDVGKQTTRIITQAADPPDVTVIPRNRALTVTFEPPAFTGLGNPTISAYNVQYAIFDGSSYVWKDWTVNGSVNISRHSTYVTITGLENGRDYQVRVRAQNGNANGFWSVAQYGFPSPDTPFVKVEPLVTGLEIPWDLAFTPDGTMLFTERKGVLRARLADGTVQRVTANLDDLEAVSEGGLMSIAVDPSFASNRRFYTCQTIDAVTSREVEVVAWTIDATYKNATRVNDPLVGGIPGGHGQHNGCRLRFGPDGYLWITTGDAAKGTAPQSLSSLAGKVLRVNASDGSGATGNPFASAPLIYTYGHRNAQGLALRPDTRQMWVVEHGPRVDDEINLLQAGGNYGWDPVPVDPNIPYNQSVPMTDLDKYPAAVAAKWSSGSPTLATSGGIFLEGEQWGNWRGRLAVAALRDRELHLFDFNPGGEFQSRLSVPELKALGDRLRSPVLGPDGALYITTSQRSPLDVILKVTAFTAADPPAEVVVARGGGGELVVEWSAPSNDGGSAISGYQLRYSEDGANWTEVSGMVTDKRWAVIGGLTTGNEYQVQVRSLNEAGSGDWSPSGRGTPAAVPVIRVETVVTGVSKPWGLAFAPDGTMMFTERGGALKVRLLDGTVRTVTADFSDIGADWETGLMGMVIDPDFGANRHFYTCQGHQDPITNAASVQVIKWSMNSDYTAATRIKDPLVGGVGIRIGIQWQHAGCRLRFGPQGHLWIATGDGYSNSVNPQDITNLNGKMLRVHKVTGEGVPGNPFYANANANSMRIYSYGHRNPQGLALRPGTSQMWSVEHGTDRDDEINLLSPGGNYGYAPHGHTECGPPEDRRTIPPDLYCVDSPMTDLDRFPDAVEARWSSGKPTLATSGGIFLEGEHWGAWEGRMAVATLKTRSVRLFNFTPEGSFISIYELPEVKPFDSRLRTPMMGPDGALYVTTSDNSPSSEENPSFQSNDETLDRILRVYVYDAQADATLTGLRLSGSDGNSVPLSPEFETGVLRYDADVSSDITGVTINPTLSRAGATVTVDGNDPSTAVSLDPGSNSIEVVVTAQDGASTRTYTVNVTREESDPATLTGLGITGTVNREGDLWLFSNPWFDPSAAGYAIRVPDDLDKIIFTPAWSDDAITAVVLHERQNAEYSLQGGSEVARASASGARLTSGSEPRYPAIEVVAGDADPVVHYFNLELVPLSFGGAAVEDMTFTEGGEISFRGLSEAEKDALRLPIASGGFYNVAYTVTGLPEGLYMGQGRLIRGTPEAATASPATVTYTATDDLGRSASLSFELTVASPLAFDPDQRQAFKDAIFAYTVGQAERIEATLPEVTGGHGALTYHLTYRVRTATGGVVRTIDEHAPGFSFDPVTRVLSSDTGALAPATAAFYSVDYWVEDESGARAVVSGSIAVHEAPTLSELADRSFTVGERVSLTLPKAVGGTQVGTGIRYRLEPVVEGLVFNGRQHLRSLSGAPYVPGTTQVTYTATDRNGVSASRSFTVTVVNGSAAPTSAPTSLQAAQAYAGPDPNGSGAAATWEPVPGASGYVVQVKAEGGSYPTTAINAAPTDVNLSLPNVDTGLVWINAISAGDYRIQVAARNADGVGPWSTEVGFSITATQPQLPAQSEPQPRQLVVGQEGASGTGGVVGQAESPYADLIAQMREWRNDPRWVSFAAHTERWDRALLAFGESVADTSLTAMTAAEAQAYADRGDAWSRWVEVAAALRAIEVGAQQQAPPNRAPTVSAAIADPADLQEGDTQEVSLAGVFSDPDGDALSISARSDDESVATVSIAADQSALTVTGVAAGEATITMTAEDADGNSVSAEFKVSVVAAQEPEPQAETEIPEIVTRYDANGNGKIDIPEYLQARRDYAYERISDAEWELILEAWLASQFG